MQRLPAGYRITRADADDIEALAAIHRASDVLFEGLDLFDVDAAENDIPSDILREAIQCRHLFVARDADGDPVGFALTSERGGSLYLDQVSVHPDHGRKGIGAALVRRVVGEAKDRRLRSVTLSTFRDPPWNRPFYRKLGFRDIKPARLEPWMEEIQAAQAETLDIDKRCFMRRRLGLF